MSRLRTWNKVLHMKSLGYKKYNMVVDLKTEKRKDMRKLSIIKIFKL